MIRFCLFIFFPFLSSSFPSTLASRRFEVTSVSKLALISSSLESVELTKRFATCVNLLDFLNSGHVSLSSEFYFALWSPTYFPYGSLMQLDDREEDGEILVNSLNALNRGFGTCLQVIIFDFVNTKGVSSYLSSDTLLNIF